MKWFKHRTDLTRDERIASYLDECGRQGLEAYGFLVRLIELIAEQMSPDRPDPSLTLPLRGLSRQLDCHHNRVTKYLGNLRVAGVVTVEYPDGKVKVTYPELRNLADDYFRKSGQGTANVRKEENRREENKTEREERAAAPPDKPLPQDFSLTEKRRETAAENCPASDPKVVFQKFQSYHRAKGTIAADWDAMWQKWTLDERRPTSSATALPGGSSQMDKRRKLDKMVEDRLLTIPARKPGELDDAYYARAEVANERRMATLYGPRPVEARHDGQDRRGTVAEV